MKVLYDHQAFGESLTTGVSRCFVELIKNLPAEVTYEIALAENSNLYIKEAGLCPNSSDAKLNEAAFLKNFPINSIWRGRLYRKAEKMYPLVKTTNAKNLRNSINILKKGDFDVFHPTLIFNDYFLDYLNKKPWVMTIHDMVSEKFSSANNFQCIAKRKLINKADAIVAISENTKKDIVEILDIPAERVVVIPHGAPTPINVKKGRLIKSPYFLYVGMRAGYKNFVQTLKDFAEFSKQHQDVKFVCTWKKFTAEENALIKKLSLQDKIFHLYASEEELANLYTNAIAFIYPSLYEGFGLPILEAYAYGCMCLLNRASCFPEVGGEGAIYFDSKPGESNLVSSMDYLYNLKTDEKEKIRQSQKKQLNYYTWTNAAIQMSNLYKSLAK